MTTQGIANWGPLVIATDVDDAVIEALKQWVPTYLLQTARERNLPAEAGRQMAAPRTYTNVLEEDEFLDHQIPMVLVTTADTAKVKGGPNSSYEAMWNVKVSAVVRGRSAQESRLFAALYEGAIRRAITQKCRGVGPINESKWLAVKLAAVRDASGKGRYLAAGIGTYNVSTDYAAQGFGGPDIPNADEYLPLATVTEVTTGVEVKD